MKRVLIACAVIAACVAASSDSAFCAITTVQINEYSYLKIYNFSGSYLADHEGAPPTERRGFRYDAAGPWHSTPTIEPKVVNNLYPSDPPDPYDPTKNAALFDCHQGYASLGQSADILPWAMVGEEPWFKAEFDWSGCAYATDWGYLYLQVGVWPYCHGDPTILWQRKIGMNTHSGHVALDLPYKANLVIRLTVANALPPVPEPDCLAVLVPGIGLLLLTTRATVCRLNRVTTSSNVRTRRTLR